QLELPIRPEWFPCEAARLFTEVSRPQLPSPNDAESLMCYVPEQDPAHMAEKMSILLVEDLEDDILLIRRAFTAAKLTTPLFAVRDGEEATAYLSGTGKYANRAEYPLPNLILLDLKMPRLDGFDFLDWLRQQPQLKAIPLI